MKTKFSFKFYLVASLLILALGIIFTSKQSAKITMLQDQLEIKNSAKQLNQKSTNSQRRQNATNRKKTKQELLEMLVNLEPLGKDDPDIDRQTLDAQFKSRIATLTSEQAEATIREILSLNNPSKSEIRTLRYCLLSLADESPSTAFELIKTAMSLPAYPKKSIFRKALVMALVNLGTSDLKTVIDWFETEKPSLTFISKDHVIEDIFRKQSRQNYDEAFRFLNTHIIGTSAQTSALYGIHETLTLESAADYLTAVRNSELSPKLKEEALEAFGTKKFAPDFKTTLEWITNQKFSPTETRGLLLGLNRGGAGYDAEWITWIAESTEKDGRFTKLHEYAMMNLLSNMISKDVAATGHLINSLPRESKALEYAKKFFSLQMTSFSPEMAVTWFNSLPEGKRKTTTGRTIYHELHEKNPQLAETFARTHNLYIDEQ